MRGQTPDDPIIEIHRRQFVIARDAHPLIAEWPTFDLGEGLHLFAEPELIVSQARDANGVPWFILGRAIETREDSASPGETIGRTRTDSMAEAAETFAGRWVLVGNGWLIPDAAAMLSVHFRENTENGPFITSSPGLLRDIAFAGSPEVVDHRTLSQIGLSWIPAPASRFAGAARLLPSQKLYLATGRVEPIRLVPPSPEEGMDEIAPALAGHLMRTLQRLAPLADGPLQLGLTAGNDSRPMLALAQKAGVGIEAFTRVSPRTSLADRLIPPQLAAAAGIPHRYLRPDDRARQRPAHAEAHSAGFVAESNLRPLLRGERDDLTGITISGGGFEISRGGLAATSKLRALHTDFTAFLEQVCSAFGEPIPTAAAIGLERWHQWASLHPEETLNASVRFFIEQRRASWQAGKNQVFDMMPVERFQLLNSRRNFALVTALGDNGAALQKRLTEIGLPELARFPVNPPDEAFAPHVPLQFIRRKLHLSRLHWTSRARLRLRQMR